MGASKIIVESCHACTQIAQMRAALLFRGRARLVGYSQSASDEQAVDGIERDFCNRK
jgi:hypothetical protein